MSEIHPSVHHTLEILAQEKRFLLVGSYGRAAILGDNIAQISQKFGRAHRFQDIDVLDTAGSLQESYSVLGGAVLDCLLTKQFRPVDVSMWGLFDRLRPQDSPLVTLSSLPFEPTPLTLDGIGTINLLPPHGQLMIGHALEYQRPYSKHTEQVSRLLEGSGYIGSEADQAMHEYTEKMKERYPISGSFYSRVASSVYTNTPTLAVAISDSGIGNIVRRIRGTAISHPSLDDTLDQIDAEERITLL
ncbi:MAG TPA: hypothetical protein VIM37_03005 [Candidatus Microsaccharimonas sp.]|jgi:hypothetical protein